MAQAFERSLAEAGSTVSVWQVLLLVRSRQWGAQAHMAEALGVTGPTLTHHLNALEDQGLVRRWRETSNRRVQRVELTQEGLAEFERLRSVARTHDRRLRSRLTGDQAAVLSDLLDRLVTGVQREPSGA